MGRSWPQVLPTYHVAVYRICIDQVVALLGWGGGEEHNVPFGDGFAVGRWLSSPAIGTRPADLCHEFVFSDTVPSEEHMLVRQF